MSEETVYKELCSSYRAIDDFRAKLLALLPLVTSGIFAFLMAPTTNTDKINLVKPFLLPIGLFGLAITLGLFIFELYGIRKCTYLIKAGNELEKKLLKDEKTTIGQFSEHSLGALKYIYEPTAAGIIYSTVLAAWAYLAAYHSECARCFVAIGFFIGGLLITILFMILLSKQVR